MGNINQVVLVGNLVRDMDLRISQSGFPVGKISIAINRRTKKNGEWTEEANFFDVKILGSTAENLAPYLLKGKQVGVTGELQQLRWQDDAGNNRNKVEVLAKDIQLLGGKGGQRAEKQHDDRGDGGYSNYTPDPGGFDDDVPF